MASAYTLAITDEACKSFSLEPAKPIKQSGLHVFVKLLYLKERYSEDWFSEIAAVMYLKKVEHLGATGLLKKSQLIKKSIIGNNWHSMQAIDSLL